MGVGPSAITLPTSLRQGLSLNKELIDSVWLACEVQGGTCLCPLTPPPAIRLQAQCHHGCWDRSSLSLPSRHFIYHAKNNRKKKLLCTQRPQKDRLHQSKGGVSSAKNNNWSTTVYQALFRQGKDSGLEKLRNSPNVSAGRLWSQDELRLYLQGPCDHLLLESWDHTAHDLYTIYTIIYYTYIHIHLHPSLAPKGLQPRWAPDCILCHINPYRKPNASGFASLRSVLGK